MDARKLELIEESAKKIEVKAHAIQCQMFVGLTEPAKADMKPFRDDLLERVKKINDEIGNILNQMKGM